MTNSKKKLYQHALLKPAMPGANMTRPHDWSEAGRCHNDITAVAAVRVVCKHRIMSDNTEDLENEEMEES